MGYPYPFFGTNRDWTGGSPGGKIGGILVSAAFLWKSRNIRQNIPNVRRGEDNVYLEENMFSNCLRLGGTERRE